MKTLYFNGPIITMDKNLPEAEAVLVEYKKIIAVGSYEELIAKTDEGTKLFDLQGKTLLPGFIESHSHVGMIAKSLQFVDLAAPNIGGKINNVADIVKTFKAELEKNPTKYHEENWLIGYRYDYNAFPNNEKLTKFELDEVSTDVPILAVHLSYHACVANSKLLEILNINEDTIDPDDTSYERVPGTKEPNGVIKEDAYMNNEEITKMVNGLNDPATWSEMWKPVVQVYAAEGYTSVKDHYLTTVEYDFLTALAKKDELILDVIGHVSVEDKELLKIMKEKWASNCAFDNKFRVNGIKIIADGTVELGTAWLSKPYCKPINNNPPGYAGKPSVDLGLMYDTIVWCLQNNKQIIIHCIGDQTSETFINFYEEALAETKSTYDIRPIMIHATTVRKDQLERMVKISMPPSFLVEEFYYLDDMTRHDALGMERSEVIAPWGWAKRLGMKFTLHHDSPVYFPKSMLALYSAVTRTTAAGDLVGENQKVAMQDALEALTISAAYQFHEDDIRGSITPDKYADFVILNHSPLTVSADRIRDIKIVQTIKDGQIIYVNNEFLG